MYLIRYTLRGDKINMTGLFSGAKPKQTAVAMITLITLVLLAYANTFNAPFKYDDTNNILENPHIRMTSLTPDIVTSMFKCINPRRPVANLSFAINYYFHGYDVRGYHVVNLIIHTITALLLFLIARETLSLCKVQNTWAPFLAAALWSVNPVHTQSVTYIVQRMTSLATMFYMLTIFFYIRARMVDTMAGKHRVRRYILYALCLLSGLLGMASKEITVTLPALIFLYEWYFFQRLDPAWLKGQLRWIAIIILALLIATALYLVNSSFLDMMRDKFENTLGFKPAQRLLTEPQVIVYYLSLLFFPHPARLNLLYDFPLSYGLTDPLTTLLALVALSLMVFSAVYLAGRSRLFSFTLVWFLINLVLESSAIALALIFEHRTYLPSMFIPILLVYLLYRYIRSEWIVTGLLTFLIATCSIWTWQRNALWSSDIGIFQDCARKNVYSPIVHTNLGASFQKAGQVEMAINHYQKAIALGRRLDRNYISPFINLGTLWLNQNRPDEALTYFREAVSLDPDNEEARICLGKALQRDQQIIKAVKHFSEAVRINPDSETAHSLLGLAYMQTGNYALARHHLEQVLRLNPHSETTYIDLGALCQKTGETGNAIYYFQKALSVNPRSTEALNNLGISFFQNGCILQAKDCISRALSIDNTYTLAQANLEKIKHKIETVRSEINRLETILSNTGSRPELLYRLGNLYALIEDNDLATKQFQHLSMLMPHDPSIDYNLACLYARQNQIDKAVTALKNAVEKGYDNWDLLLSDTDLNNLRHTAFYQNLSKNR